MADAHAHPVRFVFHHRLHIAGLPVVQALLLCATLLATQVQMLKDDNICAPQNRGIDNERRCFHRDGIVDAFGFSPQTGSFGVTVLLCLLDSVNGMVQRVLFSWQGEKLPVKDSAI